MIIGFCGKMGAGKDTAGAYLVKKYGFKRISFADKLKVSAAACFGADASKWEELKNDQNAWVGVVVYEDNLSQTRTILAEVTVREFLQRYGTEAHREVFGENFWVEQALKGIDENLHNYVITDVRFDNEAIAVRQLDGVNIQIHRNGSVKDSHASEAGISEALIDGKVANIGSFEQLYVLLDTLVERLEVGN